MFTKLPSVSVIISTYNNVEWLEKTLWGYLSQSHPNFELVVADDGSTDETKALLDRYRSQHFPTLKHVWHPDNGFEKTKILNKAIVASEGDYLIFTDQDCIPRRDFVETHANNAEKGYFISGGYFRLPLSISKQIEMEDVATGRAFKLDWLSNQGLKKNFKCTKLVQSHAFTSFMNSITPTKASWNGCNASGWREDALAINGFNEEMKYGGEDREFGERLFNMGIKSKQLRYSAICLHLDHDRPYRTDDVLQHNRIIRKDTKVNKVIRTPHGIDKL